MVKKLVFILVLILLSVNVSAFSLNLSKSTYSKENLFQGTITIDPGNYLASQKVTLTTNSSSKEVQLVNLVNCNVLDCTKTIGQFTTTGATEPSLFGPSILTGFKVKANSVIEDASFDISNQDSNFPSYPSVDIGNDNSLEWTYQGYSTNNFDLISFDQTSNFEETIITENCQLFSLPKSSKYKIQGYIKKQPSAAVLDIYMPQLQKDGSCQQPTTSFSQIECNIDLGTPIEAGEYYICLTGNNNILATNSTSTNPKGYVSCSTGCTAVNKDYIINFSAAQFISTLDHSENFNTSNTKKDSFGFYKPLTDLLNEYLETCPISDNYCIIPINISSTNNNIMRVSNLNYKETTSVGEILLQHGFLSSVTQQGTSNEITINSPTNIQLSEFDFETPSKIGTYTLQASLLSQSASQTYSVVEGPKAKINVTKTEIGIGETIKFDASESSPNNLTYLWDFGDNTNSTLQAPSHSYQKAGTFVVELEVKDSSGISSTALKTITVGGSLADSSDLLTQVDNAEQYYNTASQRIKDIYKSLKLDTEIKSAKTTLISSTSLTQTQIDSIKSKIPKSLTIQDSYEITPFLTTEDINILLPLQDENFKETARSVNEKITQTINAYLISVTYLSGASDSFIVIQNKIEVPQTIPSPLVINLIPLSLAPAQSSIKFINPPTGQVTTLDIYQNLRMSSSQLNTATQNEVVYTIASANLDAVRSIKTLVLPEDLNVALVPLNCGDSICNPGEDINICPEDCTCGNDICEISETVSSCPVDCGKTPVALYTSILVILIILGGGSYYLYKHPKLISQLRLDSLSSIFKSEKIVMPEEDLERLVSFIKRSREEGHVEKQIERSLLKKGWAQSQVNYAFKNSNK